MSEDIPDTEPGSCPVVFGAPSIPIPLILGSWAPQCTSELGELIPIPGNGSGRGCSSGFGSFYIPRDFLTDLADPGRAGGGG